jgi:hypothetical protein
MFTGMPPSARFRNITLVAVTGLADARGAAHSLYHSQLGLPGARALLLSPSAPSGLPPQIVHRAIAPMNYQDYSWFMLFALGRLIETDFALIVQGDGWVLGAENWSDNFLDYDYVGAPTHLARIDSAAGSRWVKGFEWCAEFGQPGRAVLPVFNGGFSLRSCRLMRALTEHPHIRVHIPPPDLVSGDPIRLFWSGDARHEDVQLSVVLRAQLEAVGLRFAPLDLARRFSIEHAGALHDGIDLMTVFGIHSGMRQLESVVPPVVRYAVPREEIQRIPGEQQVVNVLRARGYHVTFADEPA